MIAVLFILSFILDGIISLLIIPNSLFFPLFTLMSLLVIYKFKLSNSLYLIICGIIGLIYGITYHNALLDMGLFILIGIFIIIIYNKFNIDSLSIILLSVFLIIIYRLFTYIFLLFNEYIFNPYQLFKGIYSSLIINILYVLIINKIINILNKKNNWF